MSLTKGNHIKALALMLILTVALAFSPLTAINAHALSADSYESNNTAAEAKAISIGATIDANLASDSSYGSSANDYYKFTVTTAAPYTLEFNHAVPSGATNSYFASVRITTESEAYKASAYTKLNVAKTYVVADWLAAGTYYIEIDAYSGDTGLDQPYSFVVKKGAYIDDAYYYVRSSYTGKSSNPFRSVYSGSTTLTKGKDYTVSGSRTAVGLGKATVTGKGNYYGTHTVAFAIYPNQVMLKSVKALGNKKVQVTWYKEKSVGKYVIEYKLSSAKKWSKKTVSSSKSSLTLSKLKKGKKYNIRIYAYKMSGGKKFCSVNTDSSSTVAYTSTPGFSSYSKKTVKVK